MVESARSAKTPRLPYSAKRPISITYSSILGNKALVNSYHHQSAKNLGKDLEAVAYSSDRVVEAIERKGDLFVVGVQWHPEMMVEKDPDVIQTMDDMLVSMLSGSDSARIKGIIADAVEKEVVNDTTGEFKQKIKDIILFIFLTD